MNPAPFPRSRAAFSLVEVTLALGLAAFCLVALLGLLPLGNNQNLDASKATAATDMTGAIIADLRSVGSGGPGPSPIYQVAFPTTPGSTVATGFFASESGEYLGPVSAGLGTYPTARFQVLVRLTSAPSARPMENLVAYVRLAQPAVLVPDNNIGTSEVVTVLNR